jgi:hypothetical protein
MDSAITIILTATALSRMADFMARSVGSTVEADSTEEDLAEATADLVTSTHSHSAADKKESAAGHYLRCPAADPFF